MKLDKTLILQKLAIVITFIKRFRFIIVFTVFSLMYGYVMTQVNAINTKVPTEKQIADKATTAPKTKVDPELVDKITSLEEENVQIKTIFNEARKNPFVE
jgi:hypothetical protein